MRGADGSRCATATGGGRAGGLCRGRPPTPPPPPPLPVRATRASVYRDRALARRHNGDLELAIEDYDEAIAHDPRHAAPYHQRGLALAAAGDLDRAILSYNTAVRLDPSDAQPRLDRGLAFLARGQANEARADFEAAPALPAGKDARTRDAARAKLAELTSAEPTRLAAPGR